ncbi:transposase (plasmid) [Streptomyces poriferorum]|uniref:IS701 family transposase n=1 Tax=Streptomyces poriferorum TaxID=2798799 RepID=UPI00273F5EBD|nr:transposase [Streptomyces sp. Alt1]WLQ53852.1 transposase [Streptomyces sp. Alt1]
MGSRDADIDFTFTCPTTVRAVLDAFTGAGWTAVVPPGGVSYGANADFRHGLENRGLAYVLQVKGDMTAHAETALPHQPPYSGLGPRPLPRYRTRPVSLREHVLAAGRARAITVTWRKGSKAAMSARFVILRVRVASRRPQPAPDGVIALRWLIAQWPEGENEPVKYWISNLPADIPARDLVRLAKLRWRVEHDYRELKTTLGLDHFEGRSLTGWHRHVTLVTAAHLFLPEQRTYPKAPARA